jgi:hypothetical protein
VNICGSLCLTSSLAKSSSVSVLSPSHSSQACAIKQHATLRPSCHYDFGTWDGDSSSWSNYQEDPVAPLWHNQHSGSASSSLFTIHRCPAAPAYLPVQSSSPPLAPSSPPCPPLSPLRQNIAPLTQVIKQVASPVPHRPPRPSCLP